jgi:ribonuclease R
MQKARYATENLGHFGLASECYCHFTSPIRRYPDLCIHRILKEIIHGRYAEVMEKYLTFVERAAEQSSNRECRANDVERDVDDLYKTMYMSEHIDEEFDAVISGVASFGLFAELPNTIEGFIPIESLFGDFTYDENKMKLFSKTQAFQIGDCIRVRVYDVDFERRRTQLRIMEQENNIKMPTPGLR